MGNKNVTVNPDPDYPQVKFEEATLQPFDVLLFQGGDFVSSTIRKVQRKQLGNGSFSHAGLVMAGDLVKGQGLEPGKLYVWEITKSGKLNDGVMDVKGRS